jgi:hypothetical protein
MTAPPLARTALPENRRHLRGARVTICCLLIIVAALPANAQNTGIAFVGGGSGGGVIPPLSSNTPGCLKATTVDPSNSVILAQGTTVHPEEGVLLGSPSGNRSATPERHTARGTFVGSTGGGTVLPPLASNTSPIVPRDHQTLVLGGGGGGGSLPPYQPNAPSILGTTLVDPSGRIILAQITRAQPHQRVPLRSPGGRRFVTPSGRTAKLMGGGGGVGGAPPLLNNILGCLQAFAMSGPAAAGDSHAPCLVGVGGGGGTGGAPPIAGNAPGTLGTTPIDPSNGGFLAQVNTAHPHRRVVLRSPDKRQLVTPIGQKPSGPFMGGAGTGGSAAPPLPIKPPSVLNTTSVVPSPSIILAQIIKANPHHRLVLRSPDGSRVMMPVKQTARGLLVFVVGEDTHWLLTVIGSDVVDLPISAGQGVALALP